MVGMQERGRKEGQENRTGTRATDRRDRRHFARPPNQQFTSFCAVTVTITTRRTSHLFRGLEMEHAEALGAREMKFPVLADGET